MPSLNCLNCGAELKYSPGTGSLKCPYCKHENSITDKKNEIIEHTFDANLDNLEAASKTIDVSITDCSSCGAQIDFSKDSVHKQCTFCGAEITSQTHVKKVIKPESMLPFAIEKNIASEKFSKWIASLWFAPSRLRKSARAGKLEGAYIPFWTYDAHAETDYRGERGTHYTETEHFTDKDGKNQTREVTKTSWASATGHIKNDFDDILVSASTTIPENLEGLLQQWNLGKLVPYNEDYFKGFTVESYNRSLRDGFSKADKMMQEDLNAIAKRNIGGDEQRIHSLKTDYSNITFKHILLPIYISSYQFNKKTFRFLVNGQTGEVKGERPWSIIKTIIKILALIITIAAIISSFTALLKYFGVY